MPAAFPIQAKRISWRNNQGNRCAGSGGHQRGITYWRDDEIERVRVIHFNFEQQSFAAGLGWHPVNFCNRRQIGRQITTVSKDRLIPEIRMNPNFGKSPGFGSFRKPQQHPARFFRIIQVGIKPLANAMAFVHVNLPSLLQPEDIDEAAFHRLLQRRHALCRG